MADGVAPTLVVQGVEAAEVAVLTNSCRFFLALSFVAICYCLLHQFVCFACLPVVYPGLSLSWLAASPSCLKIINLNDTKHEKLNGCVKNKSSPPFNPEGSVCIFVCWQVKDYFLHQCTFWKGKWMRINLSTTLQAIFCIFCIKKVIAAAERA